MMAKQSKAQRDAIGDVMQAYKRGDLTIGANGPRVTNPKQAIAVALHEAGASNRETPSANRANLRRHRAKTREAVPAHSRETPAGGSKAALYAEARRRNIAGRSTMSKGELEAALR